MMTFRETGQKRRPLWATSLATGCFITMFGMLGITVGLLVGATLVLAVSTLLVTFGAAVGLFGGYVFFRNLLISSKA